MVFASQKIRKNMIHNKYYLPLYSPNQQIHFLSIKINTIQYFPSNNKNYSLMNLLPMAYLLLILFQFSISLQKVPCKCINGGQCDPYSYGQKCFCTPQYIGQICDLQATQISSQIIKESLTTNYRHFYFVPKEINYYKMTFNICMLKNPSKSNTIFFIKTEKNNGSLRELPSLFETAKIVLGENECTSFSTHYISVKRRQDQIFRKIVIGLKVMQKQDKNLYLNTYYNLSRQMGQSKILDYDQNSQKVQNISIQMVYEVYSEPSFIRTVCILFTSFIGMLIFFSFIAYLKQKTSTNQRGANSVQNNLHRLTRSLQRFNNPEQSNTHSNHNKFHHINLQIFMPVTRYGLSEFIYSASLRNSHQNSPQNQPQTCSICLIQFQNDEQIRTTPCKHRYHRQCIDNWFQNKFSCPICRRKIDFRSQMRQLYYQFLRNQLIV